jgi:Ca-activated chloride channel family protein
VWVPGSSAWVQLTHQSTPALVPATWHSIAKSPLVMAMQEPMARALGWPRKAVGWSDLYRLTDDGWAAYGHPEWGRFQLGQTNPNISTSGLNWTIAAMAAANARPAATLRPADVSAPATQNFVRALELATVHYGKVATEFLADLREADDQNRFLGDGPQRVLDYVSAVAV